MLISVRALKNLIRESTFDSSSGRLEVKFNNVDSDLQLQLRPAIDVVEKMVSQFTETEAESKWQFVLNIGTWEHNNRYMLEVGFEGFDGSGRKLFPHSDVVLAFLEQDSPIVTLPRSFFSELQEFVASVEQDLLELLPRY